MARLERQVILSDGDEYMIHGAERLVRGIVREVIVRSLSQESPTSFGLTLDSPEAEYTLTVTIELHAKEET